MKKKKPDLKMVNSSEHLGLSFKSIHINLIFI